MAHTELKPLPPTPTPPQSSPLSPQSSPTNDDLLTALFALNGDIDHLIRDFNLSPKRFLAFAKDLEVIETLAAWEAMQERHHRILARQKQASAAEHLSLALLDTASPIETRRAATALARLATHMLSSQRPTRQPSTPPTQSSALNHQSSSPPPSSAPSLQHSPPTQSSALSPQHSTPPSTARPAA